MSLANPIGRRRFSGRPRILLGMLVLAAVAVAVLAWRLWPGPLPEPADVVAALELGRYDAALDLTRRRSQAVMLPARERLMKAEAEIGLGRYEEALADLAAVADSDPLAGRARLAAGQVELWRRNRARPAEQVLLRALDLAPDLMEVRRELVKLYDIQGRTPERDAQFRAIAARSALSLDELLMWTRIKRPDGETNEVVQLLERFVAADPGDEPSRIALASQLQRLGRLDEAERTISELPESSPRALAIRVRIALERGDRRSEERLLALGGEPSAELSRIRGRRALLDQDARSALEHYQQAHEREPADRETLLGLGQSSRLLGDEAGAKRWLDQVARTDAVEALVQRAVTAAARRDARLLSQIAAACEAARQVDQARAWYQFALAADPLDTASQRALFRLRQPPEEQGERAMQDRQGPS